MFIAVPILLFLGDWRKRRTARMRPLGQDHLICNPWSVAEKLADAGIYPRREGARTDRVLRLAPMATTILCGWSRDLP